MNFASLSFSAIRRTRSSALGALTPARCPERVLLDAFPSGSPLPSTASAPAEADLFGGFACTMGLSDFPWSCIEGLRPWPSPRGPDPRPICHPASHKGRGIIDRDGRPQDLPVLARGDSVHAQVLRPRGVRWQLAITRPAMLPSANYNDVGTHGTLISRLDSPACTYPCQRFTPGLTDDGA